MSTVTGRVEHPTNRTYQQRGSIHDDATAQRLGFRGGTIAASTHLDVLPPVLIDVFGDRWFEDGCISMYFRHATVDGEPVQARIEVPDGARADRQLPTTLLMPDGTVIAEGTASVGSPAEPSALFARDLRHDPADLRIQAGLQAGDAIGPATTRCAASAQAERCADGLVAAALDWYSAPSPWGVPVVAPSTAIDMFTKVAAEFLLGRVARAVGLWGAMELRFHHGPLLCDVDYLVSGSVVALGQTPQTETLWYDLVATDDGGHRVASTRVLTRFAKGSSDLYP
jgi:hypothetical protein